jgi:hypothetical protein
MLSMGRIRWVREVGAGSYVLGLTLIRRALWLSNLSQLPTDVGPVSSSSNPSLRRRIRRAEGSGWVLGWESVR